MYSLMLQVDVVTLAEALVCLLGLTVFMVLVSEIIERKDGRG
jgi:hypothetical protein